MCGISGYYSKSSLETNLAIRRMNESIAHRGPDSTGVWSDKKYGITLGHQRLSVIDLNISGNQPMQSNSGNLILTYNGEIYNFLEIKKDLEQKNSQIKWRGRSDTEILLEALETWGIEKTLNRIDGMFAFGLWNRKNHSLTLARDRVGEKPLYFGWQGEGENKVFLFGSELKALRAHPDFNGQINRDAIALQLRYNCIPAPYTIYKNIYKLLPGHYLELNEIDLKKKILPRSKVYWSLVENAVFGNKNQIKELNEIEIKKDLEKLLQLSVKKQMISDVPIGAFLSGGIDSSTIAAIMQSQSNIPIKTFTIGFNENDYSEAIHAKKIAKHLGTNHTELYVSSKKALEIIPNIPQIYDEPFSDSSQIPTFLISQLAKNHVKVALSGDGGDELFCGYNRHLMSGKMSILALMPRFFKEFLSFGIKLLPPQGWNKISNFLPVLNSYNNIGDKIYKGAEALKSKSFYEMYYMLCSNWQNPCEVLINAKEPGTLLTKFKPELKGLSNQQQMMALDSITYLPDDILVKVDRAAMATSLETRMPFLDHKLIEYVWRIPHSLKYRNSNGKWILKEILNNYIPKNLIDRPKMGFSIPLDKWLRGPLKDWAESLLNEKRLNQENFFNTKLVRDIWSDHLSGRNNRQSDIWAILMFQAWIDSNKIKD